MIKPLSYTEVQRHHKELAQEMLNELRSSNSENNQVPVEKILWAYYFETVDSELDVRKRSKDIDRSIRREKLLKLDEKLRSNISKTNPFLSLFTTSKKGGVDVISKEINELFSNIVTISLVIKVGDYERFKAVEKTSLFLTKMKEELGVLTF